LPNGKQQAKRNSILKTSCNITCRYIGLCVVAAGPGKQDKSLPVARRIKNEAVSLVRDSLFLFGQMMDPFPFMKFFGSSFSFCDILFFPWHSFLASSITY